MANPIAGAMQSLNAGGTRRFVVLGGVAVAALAVYLVSQWASAPSYVTLYRDLELTEVGAMTEQLGKAGIRYQLSQGGAELQVPGEDMARARVLLARQGLPSSGRPGLELFDKPTWGMTDFTQRVTWRRALEGELARTIGTIRGVRRAQVHLALVESSPLRRLERPAEAAVVLTLQSGVTLGPDVVQGIAYIVSSSVDQLSSDRVAVIDDAGRVLSAPTEDAQAIGLSSRQLDMQRGVERYLSHKIEGLLDPIVGAGRARVEITARLNFEQVDRTVESYDPEGQVIQNEQRSETRDPTGQTITNNQYLNSRKVEKIVGSVGGITRLTIAVMVSQEALGGNVEAVRGRLESLVRNAVGYDAARGDQLTVTAMPFEPQAAATGTEAVVSDLEPMEPAPAWRRPESLMRLGVGVVAILAVAMIGLRALRAAGPAVAAAPRIAAQAAGAVGHAPVEVARVLPTPQSVQLRNRLQSELTSAPEHAAKVVRAWLTES